MSWAASSWRLLRHHVRCLGAAVGVCAAIAVAPAAAAPSDIAVIVSNSTYFDTSIPAVKYAAKDGDAMASAMREVFGVARENVHQFKDQTLGGLNGLFGPEGRPDQGQLFKWVQEAKNPNAHIYVYFSGHGMPQLHDDGRPGDAYLVTRDASFANLAVTAYALKTLRDNLVSLKALVPNGQIILILESCFSGRAGNGEPVQPNTSQVGLDIDFGTPPAEIIEIDAAKSNQAAFWDDKTQHGVFTDQFLWAVYGLADEPQFGGNNDGQVSVAELLAFVNKRMPDRLKVNKRTGVQTAAVSGAADTTLTSGGRRKRTDMAALEREEEVNCGALERAENASYTRLNEDIARIRKFLDEDCHLCECREKLENRQRYLEERQQICTAVADQIRTQTDPVVLRQYAETNQCPQLRESALRRAQDLQEARDRQICDEDQAHWNDMKRRREQMTALELAIDQMSCQSVRDNARAELQRRRDAEGVVARMRSSATQLGTLAAVTRLPPRPGVVAGSDVFFTFQLADADMVSIQLDDPSGSLEMDLRDQSHELVARPRQGAGPNQKDVTVRLNPGRPYYIRIAPAEGRRGGNYVLRVAKGANIPPQVGPGPAGPARPENTTPTPVTPAATTHFTRETAAAMGADPVSYALPDNQNDFWVTLTVPAGSRLTPVLNWTDQAVDLDYEVFRGAADRIAFARTRGTIPTRGLDRPLDPGTYLIHVYRTSGKGAVLFNLTTTRTTASRTTTTTRGGR
jgi:hypothetical protein